MAHTYLKSALVAALVLALQACGGDHKPAEGQPSDKDSLDTSASRSEGGVVKVGGQIIAVPSPVQTALLIKKLGLPYEKELPLEPSVLEKLATSDQHALALGAFGADLAYVTVHRDGQRALNILQTIQTLSGKLDLSNAFDQGLLDSFKKSLNNEDSLLRFSGTAYRAADQYLKNNDRNVVSSLVLAGGWIESMYLTVSGAGTKPDAGLMSRLGEQRRTLTALVAMFDQGEAAKGHEKLLAGLKDLLAEFDGVTTTYQFQPPTVDAAKKTTYINSTSTVAMAPEKFAAIATKVKALRTTITA
jgi:hypothetical protein